MGAWCVAFSINFGLFAEAQGRAPGSGLVCHILVKCKACPRSRTVDLAVTGFNGPLPPQVGMLCALLKIKLPFRSNT